MGDYDALSAYEPAQGGGGYSDLAMYQVPGSQPAPQEQPGTGESILRGAFQGVTLGFGDELTGLVRSLVDNTSYQENRDAARQLNKNAQEAHPFAYGGAELAAGLATPIPGLGAVKGAGVAAHALHAAAAGGLAGLGASEADLMKGDFGGAVHDTIQNAMIGGALGVVGSKLGKVVGGAAESSEERAIKALAGGESKTSGAAWQKTKRMVNNPETRNILREPVQLENDAGKTVTTTLEKSAGKSPDVIQGIVDEQTSRINGELRPIYAKADAKSGGVSLKDYIGHLDEQIAKTADMAPAEARVYKAAISELKENAIQQWGQRNPNLLQALESSEAQQPQVRNAIMKQFDVKIPSEDVRAEATALQKIGFKTVDPLNPGLQTQVKRDMGNMVRDFVNGHVMQTLGGEDHSKLLGLNKRMNAWLGVGTVAAARAEKEAAGRVSMGGHASKLLGHGSLLGAAALAAHGNIAGAVAAYALPKAIEHGPAAARAVTRGVAAVDTRLKAVADAAAAGNPFAQKLLAGIRQAPGGAARLAALERGQGSAPQPAPEGQPDASFVLAQQ